ncbi:hypothetical protein Ccrd_009800 [Cynara cardunculus var. scolymus]|uniref:Multi antimicrobial extrusion protein n=2 Tax=Cynara cardunculus var. scolymus TaxID=59895 RepID=A0A103YM99_CYNCS|nr:hypothetical protein Ccrd_009800 [Cynara cardunculus var. scolymus]
MEEEGLGTPFVGQESEKRIISYSKDEILGEFKKQVYLAGPLMTVNLLICGLSMISVMFVGHLGELALSGASMATSFASVTGTSLMIGMGSALDTFCGQSYGAKRYHLLGIHMQRAMIVLLSVSIPLAFIWAYAGYLLVFLGQDPQISAEAGLYARFMIPSLFANALLQCFVRFLQAQNNVVPMMLSTGITTLLHILVCWIMVFKSGLGNRGAALANAISLWINVLLLAVYVRVSPSLEIWSFEMMVLLSGLLPNPQLETSVLSISLNTCSMIYMIPLGLSSATRSLTMKKGSTSSGNFASKTVGTIGIISADPVETTVTFNGGKGVGSFETKSRVSYGDKQSGCYGRKTTKEKASAGEFQWKNGTSGTKSEYKKSSTVRVGNKSGYTEIYSEQRVRDVSYNKSKYLIEYDNGDNGYVSDY